MHHDECTAFALAEERAFTVAATSLSSASTCRSSFGCCRTCGTHPAMCLMLPSWRSHKTAQAMDVNHALLLKLDKLGITSLHRPDTGKRFL